LKKFLSIFITILLATHCSTSPENDFYTQDKKLSKLEFCENITGTKFPEESRIVTSADSNFVSIVIIKFHKHFHSDFMAANKFFPIKDSFPQTLLGIEYLDSTYKHIPENSRLLRRRGRGNGTLWMCLLDTTTCRIYCNLSFPNTKGNTKRIWYDPFAEELSPEKEKFSK
jgi:hypothetical protein